MRHSLIIFFYAILIVSISTQAFAQVDSSNGLVRRHWIIVKDAHQKFLRTTITFCSLNQIKSKHPEISKELIDKSNTFLNFLDNTPALDSTIATKIDSLNFSLLKSLVTFFDKLQKDKPLFSQPKIKQEGKRVEQEIQNIGRQVHGFNYWINNKNRINIKFKDIGL